MNSARGGSWDTLSGNRNLKANIHQWLKQLQHSMTIWHETSKLQLIVGTKRKKALMLHQASSAQNSLETWEVPLLYGPLPLCPTTSYIVFLPMKFYVDWRCIHIYGGVQCGHNASLSTSRGGSQAILMQSDHKKPASITCSPWDDDVFYLVSSSHQSLTCFFSLFCFLRFHCFFTGLWGFNFGFHCKSQNNIEGNLNIRTSN